MPDLASAVKPFVLQFVIAPHPSQPGLLVPVVQMPREPTADEATILNGLLLGALLRNGLPFVDFVNAQIAHARTTPLSGGNGGIVR